MLTDHLEGFPVEGEVAVPGREGGAVALLLQALRESSSSSAAPALWSPRSRAGPTRSCRERLPGPPVPGTPVGLVGVQGSAPHAQPGGVWSCHPCWMGSQGKAGAAELSRSRDA